MPGDVKAKPRPAQRKQAFTPLSVKFRARPAGPRETFPALLTGAGSNCTELVREIEASSASGRGCDPCGAWVQEASARGTSFGCALKAGLTTDVRQVRVTTTPPLISHCFEQNQSHLTTILNLEYCENGETSTAMVPQKTEGEIEGEIEGANAAKTGAEPVIPGKPTFSAVKPT